MKSEFIIFVVFATLAQGFRSQVLTRDLSFLPSGANNDLNQISINQASTLKSGTRYFNPIFNIIRDLTTAHVTGLTIPAYHDAAEKSAKPMSQIEDAFDYTLSTVLIASRKTTCNEVEKARSIFYRDWKNIYGNVTEAIDFVQSSDLTEAASEKLNDYKTLVHSDIKNTIKVVAHSLRICAGITSYDELKVMKTFESRMYLALRNEMNHFFNAILYYWYALTTKSSDMHYVYLIEQEKRRGDIEYMSYIVNRYSMLKTIYINSYLGKSEIFDELAEMQLSHTSAIYSFYGTVEILFERMNHYLIAESIGASSNGDDISTADKTAGDEAGAKWVDGTCQILKSMKSIHPSSLEAEQEVFINIDKEVAFGFKCQYNTAKNASYNPNAVSQIKAVGDKTEAEGKKYIKAMFKLITAGKKFTCDVKSELKTLRTRAIKELNVIMSGFTKAYSMMAEIMSGKNKNVLSKNLASLSTIKRRIVTATENMNNMIYVAQMTVLIAD